MSETPDWALYRIREARERQLPHLDLGNPYPSVPKKLNHIPFEVFELISLTSLDLRENAITTLPDQIARLPNLTMLDLSSNQLGELPETITHLTNLTHLNLSGNQLSKLPEAITHLTNLLLLNLHGNQLGELPEAVTHLTNLQELYLSSNQLNELPETITCLTNLQKLGLNSNQLGELPEVIARLTSLQMLSLGYNRLSKLPDSIALLPNLEHLDLSVNQLDELPEAIARLPNLKELYLGENPIEIPPPEILDLQGMFGQANLEKIRNYYDQLAAGGVDQLCEAKLLIVGEAGAGKTSLANKIIDPGYQLRPDEETTEGIEVLRWSFTMEDGRPFTVNIWDFGGQEIYHTTHQFFLTKRSLYALVADTRKEDTDFFYWLNVVELLSDKSPLLIIKNEKQDRHREFHLRQLQDRFDSLKESLATNLAYNRGLEEVINHLKRYLLSLPLVGAPLPSTWVRVREALEADPRNCISSDEFREICRANGFEREEDILTLSGYLHDLGVCLHFRDDRVLRDVVILKPEWGTDAVYRVLDNHEVIRNLGHFTWDDLDSIWHEPKYAGMHRELLSLMLKFKLCYRLPGTDDIFIAPQLLTEDQPEYIWDEADNLQLRYTYEFMPKGILTRFIVATHRDIAIDQANGGQQLVWKTGVILERKDTRAEVIEDNNRRTLYVRIAGRRKHELMTLVILNLEAIHESFHELRHDMLIPCNCKQCASGEGEIHFFKLEMLERAMDVGAEVTCEQSFELINPRWLIHDVLENSRQLLAENQPKYKWDDTDSLQLHFAYNDFMPRGILFRFIAAMYQDGTTVKDNAGLQLVWRCGVVLDYEDTLAEVIEDYFHRKLKIRIAGRSKRELAAIVFHNLETIHRSFHDLRYDVLIHCNCEHCTTSGNKPHFFLLKVLARAFDAGAQVICEQSFELVDPRFLIQDVIECWRQLEKESDKVAGSPPSLPDQSTPLPESISPPVPQPEPNNMDISRDPQPGIWVIGLFWLAAFALVMGTILAAARLVSFAALLVVLPVSVLVLMLIAVIVLAQRGELSGDATDILGKMLDVLGEFMKISRR